MLKSCSRANAQSDKVIALHERTFNNTMDITAEVLEQHLCITIIGIRLNHSEENIFESVVNRDYLLVFLGTQIKRYFLKHH